MQNPELNEAARAALAQLTSFLARGEDGQIGLIDPNDGARVPAHYGETHLCAAMLMNARREGGDALPAAFDLFDGIMAHWTADAKAPSYHFDFNNFALALIYRQLCALGETGRAETAAKALLTAGDSRNQTTNWLPMRAYVNLQRYVISKDEGCLAAAAALLEQVKGAMYADGTFDDLLPKGKSFNLQYCISTAAELQLIFSDFAALRDRLPRFDIEKTMETLYGLVLPDGDVNYMGRGCNQLFAWGPWFYLARTYPHARLIPLTEAFFLARYRTATRNHNLMLNDFPGAQKLLWWDYHYYSVYAAHFLMWHELSCAAEPCKAMDGEQASQAYACGLTTLRTKDFCAVTFSGREHYLIEKGPAVVAVCAKGEALFKCGHAPAAGRFSDRYFNPLSAYLHHFGLIGLVETGRRSGNRLVRKLRALRGERDVLKLEPAFSLTGCAPSGDGCAFAFRGNGAAQRFILPVTHGAGVDAVRLAADGKPAALRLMGCVPSQYGLTDLYCSDERRAGEWILTI